MLRVLVPPPLGVREGVMSAGDLIGLVISLLVLAYLVYALFRAEEL
ncbi:MAG TPA: potassium-transporting ATPase subunit F [Gaiellaceae bacterium]